MILASILFFFFFSGFCFVCKFSTKLSREEICEISPCSASAGCDRRGKEGAAATVAAGKQLCGEHQPPAAAVPKPPALSFSIPVRAGSSQVLSAELGWEKTYFS